MTNIYVSTGNLDELSFIGGTKVKLYFDVLDENGIAINLGGKTCYWVMSRLGTPGTCLLYKTGYPLTTVTNRFSVILDAEDTRDLAGKFIHQPIIVDSIGYEYRPAQGYLTIIPAIDETTASVTPPTPDPSGYPPMDGSSSKMLIGDGTWMVRQAITLGTIEGVLSVIDSPFRFYNLFGEDRVFTKIFLSVSDAPVGASLIVDIHKNGTTIFTNQANRPTIVAGAYTGNTTTIDVSTWAENEYITIHVDQVGSTTPGSNLTVHVVHRGG